MGNPGSDKLKMVASLTNKIRMDDPCNIQFTSGVLLYYVCFLSITIRFSYFRNHRSA